jgi:hypothetical protein
MSDRSRITSSAAVARAVALAAVGVFAFGAHAAAEEAPPVTDPVPETAVPEAPVEPVVAASSAVTLPLFGASLVVDINVDPGGNLVDVALNQPGDFTATTVKPNKVVFVNEADGVKVKVKAKHGGQRIEARAAELADVSGPGQWKGDIFENGQTTVVDFMVGALADGSPDLTGVTVTSPLEFTIGEVQYDSGDKHGGVHARASVAIQFTDSGESRTVWVSVSLRTSESHTSANLSIGLSRIKGAEIPEGDTVGAHSWSGMLCDGTTATIDYTVGEDGSIADVTASPEGAEIKTGEHGGVGVRFATGESVRINVRDSDRQLQVGADDRIHCDAGDPSVNTEIDDDADTGDRDDRGDHDDRSDRDDRGDHRGDGSHDESDRSGDEDRGNQRHNGGDA